LTKPRDAIGPNSRVWAGFESNPKIIVGLSFKIIQVDLKHLGYELAYEKKMSLDREPNQESRKR
jgi:hypothetical protein